MKTYSMRAIPAAAAMVAALVFGVQVQAQTSSGLPPGSTNPKDASVNTGPAARAGAEANNSSGSPVGKSATMTPGTTNPKDNVNLSPAGVTPAKTAAPGMNGSNPITPGTTGIASTTNPKDVVVPKGTKAKTASERSTARSERASARAAKRAARASKRKTDINNSAETPGGSMSSTATSPSR